MRYELLFKKIEDELFPIWFDQRSVKKNPPMWKEFKAKLRKVQGSGK